MHVCIYIFVVVVLTLTYFKTALITFKKKKGATETKQNKTIGMFRLCHFACIQHRMSSSLFSLHPMNYCNHDWPTMLCSPHEFHSPALWFRWGAKRENNGINLIFNDGNLSANELLLYPLLSTYRFDFNTFA